MNLQQLSTFCTVMSEGSMTAAAEKLYLTQPAVSQQIRALEDELGVPLLHRGVRQVKPTIQGQMLFEYSKKILHLTQQAEMAIQTISQKVSGYMRMGTINSIGMYLISPIIGLFLKHNTHLNVKVIYSTFEDTIKAMKAGEVDLAILPDLKSEFGESIPEFEERFLAKDEMWLVCSSKDTSLPNKISVNQFNDRPILVFSEMYPGFKKLMEQIMVANKVEFMPVFETDNVGTLKRVIESGLGWGFLPAHSIRKQVRTKRMNVIDIPELTYSVDLKLYTRKTEQVRQMSEVFFRAFQQQSIQT